MTPREPAIGGRDAGRNGLSWSCDGAFASAREHHGMNKNPTPDSPGQLEFLEPSERALASVIVADAVERYIEATRARIVPFVDDHFSFSSAWALHRRALGRDLLRALLAAA